MKSVANCAYPWMTNQSSRTAAGSSGPLTAQRAVRRALKRAMRCASGSAIGGIKRCPLTGASGGEAAGRITIRPCPLEPHGASGMSGGSAQQDPNKLGWGFAAVIIALAIVANVAAFTIHKATYLKPDKPAPSATAAEH